MIVAGARVTLELSDAADLTFLGWTDHSEGSAFSGVDHEVLIPEECATILKVDRLIDPASLTCDIGIAGLGSTQKRATCGCGLQGSPDSSLDSDCKSLI
ncbi:MAG TPA: hypothetical protein VMM15_12910 [Bradyrhizobium sp.]|nr:hypothetical protein [Bradyrhizobium sp.]